MLWPDEAADLGAVAPKRRQSFVAGRRCARLAIEQLGVPPSPLLRGEDRAPRWPPGVTGSITHTEGYAAAAVARDGDLRSLGIDAEPDVPLKPGVLRRIARPEELAQLDVGGAPVAHLDRALFCIKESVYKAWHPVAQRWLGFQDARVELDAASGRFTVELLVDGPIRRLDGRFGGGDDLILAVIEHRDPR